MTRFEEDADAVLIHRLFGPDAKATRDGLDDETVRRIDAAAADVLGPGGIERALRSSEADSERRVREIASRVRSILSESLLHIDAQIVALKKSRSLLDEDADALRAERERLLQNRDHDGEPS